MRSTPSGARSSTNTTHRAPPSPRRGSHASRRGSLREPGGPRSGVQLRPPAGRLRRRRVPPDHHPQPAGAPPVRRLAPPGCSPTTMWSGTPPATACPKSAAARQDGKGWLRTGGTAPALDVDLGMRRAGGRDPADAGPAGLRLPVPGRGTRPARGSRHPSPPRPGPTFTPELSGADPGRDGCRVPLPWRGTASPSFGFGTGAASPPPAGLRRTVRGRRPDTTARLNALALPPGSGAAAASRALTRTRLARRRSRGLALRARRRLALHHDIRHRTRTTAR